MKKRSSNPITKVIGTTKAYSCVLLASNTLLSQTLTTECPVVARRSVLVALVLLREGDSEILQPGAQTSSGRFVLTPYPQTCTATPGYVEKVKIIHEAPPVANFDWPIHDLGTVHTIRERKGQKGTTEHNLGPASLFPGPEREKREPTTRISVPSKR